MYEEARRQIKKFDGLVKTLHKDPRVHQDEIYFFRRPISLTKVDGEGNVIPELPPLKAFPKLEWVGSPMSGMKSEVESMMEDSLDAPPSLASSDVGSNISTPNPTHPTPAKKTPKTPGKKVLTGYILYSAEVRKSVAEQNPDKSFGEISRMVGNDVRSNFRRIN
jgi:protein polybromo-1